MMPKYVSKAETRRTMTQRYVPNTTLTLHRPVRLVFIGALPFWGSHGGCGLLGRMFAADITPVHLRASVQQRQQKERAEIASTTG